MAVLAPLENKRGSSAFVDTGYIHSPAASLKRYLRGANTTKSRVMLSYAALFVYSNVEALDNFVDHIRGLTLENNELLGFVSGNTHITRSQ